MHRSPSFDLAQPQWHVGDSSTAFSEVGIEPPGPRFPTDLLSRLSSVDLRTALISQEVSHYQEQWLSASGKSPLESERLSIASTASSEGCESLDVMVGIGDIVVVESDGSVGSIGEIHGSFGHVLLVSGSPECIREGSDDADGMEKIWPEGVKQVWIVPTVECTRRQQGMLHSKLLIYNEPGTDQFLLLGEMSEDNVIFVCAEPVEKIQFLCCPGELRACCQSDLMAKTLRDMDAIQRSWSWSTAIRAYLFSSSVLNGPESVNESTSLEQIRTSWESSPICTSIIIVFWQQYLCALAAQDGDRSPMKQISEYMPLKADRALPSKLIATLKNCGWVWLSRLQS
jgi:hypothetical protein